MSSTWVDKINKSKSYHAFKIIDTFFVEKTKPDRYKEAALSRTGTAHPRGPGQ